MSISGDNRGVLTLRIALFVFATVVCYVVMQNILGYENEIVVVNHSGRDLNKLVIALDGIELVSREVMFRNSVVAVHYKGSLVDKTINIQDESSVIVPPFSSKLNATSRSGACLVVLILDGGVDISWNSLPAKSLKRFTE